MSNDRARLSLLRFLLGNNNKGYWIIRCWSLSAKVSQATGKILSVSGRLCEIQPTIESIREVDYYLENNLL